MSTSSRLSLLALPAPVPPQIEDGSEFYEAEERHQRYYAKQGVPDLPPPCLPPLVSLQNTTCPNFMWKKDYLLHPPNLL